MIAKHVERCEKIEISDFKGNFLNAKKNSSDIFSKLIKRKS
jgi:hypothetical protein